MQPKIISKAHQSTSVTPNLTDYTECCNTFSWQSARACIDGLPGGAINIAYEAVDRHVHHGRGDKVAIRWLGKSGAQQDISYRELAAQTNRFASVLQQLGLNTGERVFGLAGRTPALYIALLGTLKNGNVFSPLFSAFGPEPVRERMRIGDARVLVTTERLYRKSVMPWRDSIAGVEACTVAGCVGVAAARLPGYGQPDGAGRSGLPDRRHRAG